MNTVILGAGVTGLAAGYKTGYPVYEASNHHGGICRSYWKYGFQFETGGGHWIFGNNEAVDFIKTLVPLKTYERRAGIYYNKIFPYPIQTFSEKPNTSTPGFFKEWLGQKFSNEMCNMFFYPFNEKYTAGLYDEIVQFDAYKTPPAGSVGFVPVFHDPVDGLSSLMDKMAEKCDVKYGHTATRIDPEKKEIYFNNGKQVKYDRLISTVPLSMAMSLCGRRDFNLPYSSVFVLNIGADPGPNLPKEHWLYIPFCNTNFYRVGFYTNVEANKAPEGKVSLCVEMAFGQEYDYEDLDVNFIITHVVSELQSWGWIGNVIVTDPTWVKHAYTWMQSTEERENHLSWLKERDITSIGRYGKWKFQGMAESITDGLAVT